MYTENQFVARKAIETIGVLGNEREGVVVLIHELFQRGGTNPAHLEAHIQSYGGQILKFIENEIENETTTSRKSLLLEFSELIGQDFQITVNDEDEYKILL